MKKSMMLAAFAAFFMLAHVKAQNVNGVKLSEIRSDYIEIRETHPFMSEKVWIMLEFGQKINDASNAYIKDDDGKQLEFNSAIDCLNKMKNYGYELFQAYGITESKTAAVKYYILKRK